MELDDIYYFSVKKIQHRQIFDFVNNIVNLSENNDNDKKEIQRRISLLKTSTKNEHIRQCTNFLAETAAFNHLIKQGVQPHWVSESTFKMPDMQFSNHPVEVKHINSPRLEHDALCNGEIYGGSVDKTYGDGLHKKVNDFINDATLKFISYNRIVNKNDSTNGTLYVYFSKSIDAGIIDSIEWEEKMKTKIINIANDILKNVNDINLIVVDIDSLLTD